MNSLLLIDGNAIMHRAYHALPPLKSSKGVSTGMVYGFMSMLHKVVSDLKPSYIVVCFDTPKPTFRKELYTHYQAQRPIPSDDFKEQIPLVKKLLDTSKILRVEAEGYEADDVLGTIASQTKNRVSKIYILTGDKDIFQLVDEITNVVTPLTGISSAAIYDSSKVMEKMGVPPNQIADYKALVGDPSDNYPGAKGIGPKTAIQLLLQFLNVETLLNHVNQIENPKIKKLIQSSKKDIELSKKLSLILTNIPINLELDKAKFTGFNPELNELLKSLEMNSLRKKMFGEKNEETLKTKKIKEPVQSGLF